MGLRTISTVVAAAPSTALCALADVKEELGLGTDASSDSYLGKLITRCSAAIAQYCNMVQVPETVQDRILPEPEPEPEAVASSIVSLQLSRYPVAAITSLTEGGQTLTIDLDFALDAADGILYRLDAAGGLTAWAKAPIVVVFQAGQPVPADLADAAIRLVKARWFARGRDPMLRSENIPGVREAQYWVAASGDDGNLPPDIRDLLQDYRAPVIA